ncbi:MAG TPA: hypothetical protein VFE47_01700 [Tepidisphaeraceae bacterium]|jgi:hypothetical protein|nr:hypothetical protein [Tepidisphaeraceae bacterium]
MLQLNPPLMRVVVGGPGWEGPTGKGVANFLEPGHRDDDIVWIIDMDANGQTWCVPNRYVRAPANITYGRRAETHAPAPTNGNPADLKVNGQANPNGVSRH